MPCVLEKWLRIPTAHIKMGEMVTSMTPQLEGSWRQENPQILPGQMAQGMQWGPTKRPVVNKMKGEENQDGLRSDLHTKHQAQPHLQRDARAHTHTCGGVSSLVQHLESKCPWNWRNREMNAGVEEKLLMLSSY